MDITAQPQQDQDSTLRVREKEINEQSVCSLISKKFLLIFYVDIQLQKNLIIDMAKQEGNVLLLHILICLGHYCFVFLMQISSSLPILIRFTNAVHAAAFSSADTCLSDSTFPLYLLNRT